MAVKIRLTRTGRRNAPFYRVVVQDERKKRDGEYIELVGRYAPRDQKAKQITLKSDRIQYWMSKGAKPTLTVARLIKHYSKQAAAKA